MHGVQRTIQEGTAVFAALLLIGCEPPAEPHQPATAPAVEARKLVLWKPFMEGNVVAVNDAADKQALAKATADAKKTLADARSRWMVATTSERSLWAVKWAAPRSAALNDTGVDRAQSVDHGSVEHVWVQPITWSAFRVEGTLLSDPTAALEASKRVGETVSFPIDEVSDWIHFASEDPGAAFEGGYTVRVLEERFGKPSP